MHQLELSPPGSAIEALNADLDRKLIEARSALADAKRRLTEAEEAEAFWASVRRHLAAGHSATVLLKLRQSQAYLGRLKSSGDPAADWIPKLEAFCRSSAQEAAGTFGRAFPELLRQQDFYASFPIDPTSRHPKYTLANAFLKVDLDERSLTAEITPRDGAPILIGMDVDYVVGKLREEISRLFRRDFDAGSFLRSLFTAYQAVLRAEKRPDGDAVPLRRVSNRLAKNVNRFMADEFNVDLARVVKEGHVDVEGRRLHLDHTRNIRQGMLLHGLEEGGYVGFISFKRDG
jgi:hypothetical protein